MKSSAEGAAQQSPGRRRRSRPEPWIESAEVRALKGRRSHVRGGFCTALSGLGSGRPCTQGSGSRWRGLLHPGLCCNALSGLVSPMLTSWAWLRRLFRAWLIGSTGRAGDYEHYSGLDLMLEGTDRLSGALQPVRHLAPLPIRPYPPREAVRTFLNSLIYKTKE